MKKTKKTIQRLALLTGVLIPTLLLTGCFVTTADMQQQSMRTREDLALVREELQQTKGRIQLIQDQQEQLWQELERIKLSSSQQGQSILSKSKEEMERLQKHIAALEEQRVQDRKKIVNQMSKTIADVVSKSQTAGGHTRISEYGVEHTVAGGETLSEIASAYGVSVRVLIQANKLQNPDRLKVGQKIFIPE